MGSDCCWLDQIQISQRQEARQGRMSELFHVYQLEFLFKIPDESLAPSPKVKSNSSSSSETSDDRHLFHSLIWIVSFNAQLELGVTRFRVESGTNSVHWPHPSPVSIKLTIWLYIVNRPGNTCNNKVEHHQLTEYRKHHLHFFLLNPSIPIPYQ